MKFGVCGEPSLAEAVLAAGFDYIEVGASTFAQASDFDPSAYRGAEASNLFFPPQIGLAGPMGPTEEYAALAVARAAQIGVRTMVIGSGASRRAAEGTSVGDAEDRFVEVAVMIQELARPHGIVVAPESLNRKETNVWNDLRTLADALAARGVAYCADSYHVLVEWQESGGFDVPDPELWRDQLPTKPAHVHVSGIDRLPPAAADPKLRGFVARLHELGYDGRVSIEGRLPEPAAFPQMCADVRALFGAKPRR